MLMSHDKASLRDRVMSGGNSMVSWKEEMSEHSVDELTGDSLITQQEGRGI